MGAVTDEACVSVYLTCGSPGEAEHIARTLVDEGLAACVNIVDGVTSVFRWEGETRKDQEHLLFVKTQQRHVVRLCARVTELHSYDKPCMVVLPLVDGSKPFLQWIREQTGG